MVEDIDNRIKQLQLLEKETEVVFECDTRQLEQTISVLGHLIERETISIPDYPALLQPSVSVGKRGTAEGELNCPCGVAFDEKSKLIYVADGGSFITTGNISVFSITGEKIRFFITRDDAGNAQVQLCNSLCLDKRQNILMADYRVLNIKVFSQEGVLLHTLGGGGGDTG